MKTFILLILTLILFSCSEKEKKCTISGGITGGDSKAILLFKASKFPVYEAEIPVSKGVFMYSLNFETPEVYWLVPKEKFKKSVINEIPFVCESGRLEITINVSNGGYNLDGHKQNKILVDYYRELNDKFLIPSFKYKDSYNAMYRNDSVFNKEFQEMQEALRKTNDPFEQERIKAVQWEMKTAGKMYTPKAKRYVDLQDSLLTAQKAWEAEYITTNTSIPSYYLFMKSIKSMASATRGEAIDAKLIEKEGSNLERFAKAFPGHPYEKIIKNTLEGLQNVYKGGKYLDFEAVNADGQILKISDAIKSNRLNLLVFWGPWSDYSIKYNRKLIPIYQQYKDKGFGLVGVTNLFGDPAEAMKVIAQEKYPWTNLMDKEDSTGVWEKYNVSYQSGGTVLVDDSGTILAVDPTIDQLKEKIAEL